MQLTFQESKIKAMVRNLLHIGNHAVPVHITDTGDRPAVVGSSGGWFTNGGTPIACPSAYAKIGWSNMNYSTDSRKVYVGQNWIIKHITKLF